jgi:hypothetical protein
MSQTQSLAAVHDELLQLEAFVDESLRLFAERRYYPRAFMDMRARWGTVKAIERLVTQGVVQSGFKTLRELAMIERSMEATVLKFPNLFGKDARACAQWRLDHKDDPLLRGRP